MSSIDSRFTSIEQVTGEFLTNGSKNKATDKNSISGASFNDILLQKEQGSLGLKFSKHASMRLEDRNIDLSGDQVMRLNDGALMAQSKGIRESLIMIDQLAFIVNIPNSTVVTAMDQTDTKNSAFTNIDGAVIN